MSWGAGRYRAVAEELVEWSEDLAERGICSRVVLVAVPPGWGRSTVLREFAAAAGGPGTPVAAVSGGLPPGQAAALREALTLFGRHPRVMPLLGLDETADRVLGGRRASGLAEAAPLLVASLAGRAAGNAWGASPAGEAGGVVRAARELARVSVAVPVVVVIDDADCLDPGLAMALVCGLAGRQDGQVLVVAAAAPDSSLVRTLVGEAARELAGRVHRAEADPSMDHAARAGLAAELLPGLPEAAAERIARQTATFGEVFNVAVAAQLTEVGPGTQAGEVVSVVDAVTRGVLERVRPSAEAVVLAWAGGALHARQLDRAMAARGAGSQQDDPRVARAGPLVWLAGPADARVAQLVAALPMASRQELADTVLGEATRLTADPDAGLAERVVARQAVHRIRGDLAGRSELTGVQLGLIRGLETLGDLSAAYDVATVALAELDSLPPAAQESARRELVMAVLRLTWTRPGHGLDEDPVAAEAVELALAGGTAVRPEARVWAAVDLLHQPGRRQDGLRLAREVTGELETRGIHGELAAQWRLLLAFHSGYAGDTALARRLLATMINTGPAGQRDAAAAVLRAIGTPYADTRLQVALLHDELTRTPDDADDDLLRLHHGLATSYETLGDYHQALHHASRELPLRRRIQGAHHRDTLLARSNVANWTGMCGDAPAALAQLQQVLPDLERVLGPVHPQTLGTRGNIAYWAGECGNATKALRLYRELLPDLERAVGPSHHDTLAARNNIASWTGARGDRAAALRLYQELLPDLERALGPGHPETLVTRNNIAYWTGESGDAAQALRLSRELLPDLDRQLGPGHPTTLTLRSNVARWTGESGDAAGALRLYRELLPGQVRELGEGHPHTLATRSNIALWTGESGDAAGALRLLQEELLPEQVRTLGPGHPDTLSLRSSIAHWTGECGDAWGALRLSREVWLDRIQVLGTEHPDTLAAFGAAVHWTEVQLDKVDALLRQGEDARALEQFGAVGRAAGPDLPRRWLEAQLERLDPRQRPLAWGGLTERLASGLLITRRGHRVENVEHAITLFNAALADAPGAAPETLLEAERGLGYAYGIRVPGDRGENLRRSLEHNQAALGRCSAAEDPATWARVQHELGLAWKRLPSGDRAVNRTHAVTALEAAWSVSPAHLDPEARLDIGTDLASVYFHAGDLDRAIEVAEAVEAQTGDDAHPRRRAGRRGNLAQYRVSRDREGDVPAAINDLTAALSVLTELAWPDGTPPEGIEAGYAERDWATLQFQLGRAWVRRREGDREAHAEQAVRAWRAALEVFTPERFPSACRATASMLARVLGDHKRWPEAYEVLLTAIRASDAEYLSAVTDQTKETTAAVIAGIYRHMVDACLHLDPPRRAEALIRAEEGRSRLLRDQLAALEIPPPPGHEADRRFERERDLLARLRELQQRQEESPPEERRLLVDEQGTLRQELLELWDEFQTDGQTAGYVALRRGEQLDWPGLCRWLEGQGPRVALLEYFALEDGLVAFLAQPGQAEPAVFPIALRPGDVDLLRQRCEREVHRYDPEWPLEESWQELAAPLVASVLPALADVELLHVVPHGALHGVPLHAVAVSGRTLLDAAAVVYAPSAIVARRLTGAPAQGVAGDALVVGNPAGDLENAEDEADVIARRFGVRPLLGRDARVETVAAALKQAQAAHFACHAFFDPLDPFSSGLELADGVLTARGILRRQISVARLVLSACETGMVEVREGDELIGLSRAFIYAGVPTLVATLWNVDDPATRDVMLGLYDGWEAHGGPSRSGRLAQALREAMLEARNAGVHTHLWAPFVMIGSPS